MTEDFTITLTRDEAESLFWVYGVGSYYDAAPNLALAKGIVAKLEAAGLKNVAGFPTDDEIKQIENEMRCPI